MKKKWLSEAIKCDICGREFSKVGKVFYDAKTITGPWGLLCVECFKEYGGKLGIGFGQEYDVVTKELLRGDK